MAGHIGDAAGLDPIRTFGERRDGVNVSWLPVPPTVPGTSAVPLNNCRELSPSVRSTGWL